MTRGYFLIRKCDSLLALGFIDEVLKICDKILKIEPNNSDALDLKKSILNELGKNSENS